jgi:WD40 repeat protein
MSATYFSTPESDTINLNSSEARLQELVDQYQLELVSTPEEVSVLGNGGPYTVLAISKDNSLAAFGDYASEIEVWNVHKKKLVATFIHSDIRIVELFFTPDGKYLISFAESLKFDKPSASSKSFIKIWDLKTKSLYGQIENEYGGSRHFVTSDSKFIVYQSGSNEVSFGTLRNLQNLTPLRFLTTVLYALY